MTTKHMLITKMGRDDYSVWLTEDLNNQDSGYSERGTKAEIKEVVDEYMLVQEDAEEPVTTNND